MTAPLDRKFESWEALLLNSPSTGSSDVKRMPFGRSSFERAKSSCGSVFQNGLGLKLPLSSALGGFRIALCLAAWYGRTGADLLRNPPVANLSHICCRQSVWPFSEDKNDGQSKPGSPCPCGWLSKLWSLFGVP